jgi:hypothetical protein
LKETKGKGAVLRLAFWKRQRRLPKQPSKPLTDAREGFADRLEAAGVASLPLSEWHHVAQTLEG